jgi:hypothetical protein
MQSHERTQRAAGSSRTRRDAIVTTGAAALGFKIPPSLLAPADLAIH